MLNENNWMPVLNSWKKGEYLKYPKSIKGKFIYETNLCDNKFMNMHRALFIEKKELDNVTKQNFGPFIEYIGKSLNKHVTSFYDVEKKTKIILPIPKRNYNFCTMKDFMDNAPEALQIFFWNFVAKEIYLFLKKHNNVYISTNQGNINYFHLKLCTHSGQT